VCAVEESQISEDVITDINIAAANEQSPTDSLDYYEFGFTYASPDQSKFLAGAGANKATVDCHYLTPDTRCYGYVQGAGTDGLKISYLVDGGDMTVTNTVIFGTVQ